MVSTRDRRRRSGDGSFEFVLFGEPLHRAGLPYGLGGLRLAALLGRFGVSLVKLVNVLTDEGRLKPLEELGGRIDLVVMLAVGEDSHLVQVFGKPGCILRDRDKANKPAAHRQVINILQRLARQSDGSIVDMNPRGSTE